MVRRWTLCLTHRSRGMQKHTASTRRPRVAQSVRRYLHSRYCPTECDGYDVYRDTSSESASEVIPTGAATAALPGATIQFQNVTAAGTVTLETIGIETLTIPPPGGFLLEHSAAFELTTNATFTGTAHVCFDMSHMTDLYVFATLRVLHGEDGVWVDRTVSSDYSTGQVCADVTHFSPLVIARRTLAPYSIAPVYDVTKAFKQGSTAR